MSQARLTNDVADALKAISTLAEHTADVPSAGPLLKSTARLVSDESYKFIIADDGRGSQPAAAGIVTFFHVPMAETHVLAVEALWFKHQLLDQQMHIWRLLIQQAVAMKFAGVVIPPAATNARHTLQRMLETGQLDGHPVATSALLLQKVGNPSPIASAFSQKPIEGAAFFAVPAVIVHTERVTIDLAGREHRGTAPLYRGEGRLSCEPHWKCGTLEELARVHFRSGFFAKPRAVPARSTAPFGGSIAEQLLHQGAVGQGAVSLSTSFDVAANYATHAGRRDKALVFTVDTKRLRGRTQVYDASATLQAACPWMPATAWQPLQTVVGALWSDLPAAGTFLQRCFEDCFERARVGLGTLAPPPTIESLVSPGPRATLKAAGVTDRDLLRVHQVFEEFAEFALGRVGAVDDLRPDGNGGYTAETHRVRPMAYFEVFARIREALLSACPKAELGWDTTPFGYLAKTARDAECFAAGPIPGDLIVEARIVDRAGRPGERMTPR